MRIASMRKLLWLLGTSLLLGSGCTVVWAICWPYDIPATTTSVRPQTATVRNTVQQEATQPTFADFEPYLDRQLRRPLVDPPPATTTPAASPTRPAPQLQIRLVGTILEAGRSMAMLTTPAGSIEVRGIGETVGEPPADAEVLDIGLNKAVLRYRGQSVTLELEGTKGS